LKKKHETSTTEFTTEKMKLMSDDESTEVPNIHKDRSTEESNSEEMPTHDVTYPSSTIKDSSFSSPIKMSSKRTIEDFLMSTMETRTEFDRRAIRPMESREDIETSTHVLSEHQMEMTTNVEPTSSFDSFGKFTGLLPDDHHSKREHEMMDQSSEESTIKTQKLTKPVAIIPGKMTETKTYTNTPMKSSVIIEHDEEKQLSQGQKQGIIEKA